MSEQLLPLGTKVTLVCEVVGVFPDDDRYPYLISVYREDQTRFWRVTPDDIKRADVTLLNRLEECEKLNKFLVSHENILAESEKMALDKLRDLRIKTARLQAVLHLLLDNIDYTAGNCRVNEMVGAVLPADILKIARESLGYVEAK